MSKTKEALEAAIAALESERIMAQDDKGDYTIEITPQRVISAIAKCKAALAEPEQKPVRWLVDDAVWMRKPSKQDFDMWEDLHIEKMPIIQPLYTSPQPREWQELSDIECGNLVIENLGVEALIGDKLSVLEIFERGVKAASATLRAKNGG